SDRRFGLLQHHACAYDIDASTSVALPIEGCGGFLRIATTSRDHRRFAAACGDGSLLVGQLIRGGAGPDIRRVDARLPVAPMRPLPTALEFVDKTTLIMGDSDGGVTLLDLERPRTQRRFVPHASVVRRIIVSDDGRRAVARYEDGPVYVIDTASFASLGRLPQRPGPSYRTAGISPDGDIYATSPGRLERWDFSAVRARELFFPEGISDLALSPDGGTLAVSHGAVVSIVDVASRTVTASHSWQRELVRTLAFEAGRASGSRLAVGTLGVNGLHLLDGAERIDLPYNRLVRKVTPFGAGAFIASDFGRRLSIFEIIGPSSAGPEVLVEDHHVSPDGRHLAVLDTGQRVWVASDWSPGHGLVDLGRWVGARKVARLDAGVVFVLDRDGLTELPVEASPTPRMRYLAGGPELGALSVSQRVLVASARDGSVHLWRRGEARPYAVIRDLERRVDEVVLAHDGSWLVAGDWTGRMLFMDTEARRSGGLEDAERAWGLTLDDLVPEAR
ncbi:MAG TPA: WD40 repeat domain-containing protein, partial [Myxococcota bacterium]|nr:WD40 repeat domain-containing protein [Myxococcota bacterium]